MKKRQRVTTEQEMLDAYTARLDSVQADAVTRALDTLGDDPGEAIPRELLEATLSALAAEVATNVAEVVRSSLMDTAQVAARLGVTTQLIRSMAVMRGLGWKLTRDWLYSPEDVAQMGVRPRYIIEAGPTPLDPPRTCTSRLPAEREAREIAASDATLEWVNMWRVTEDGARKLAYALRYNRKKERWQRVASGT